jgi:nitrogen fixation protein FixH
MSASMFDPRRSRWIPWAFVGGMTIVVIVNVFMAYMAISTFTGVTVPRSYERGRGYEAVLSEAARQDALGWRAEVAFAEGRVAVTALDREGRPLAGRLEGVLMRPLEGTAVPLAFEARGGGRYAAEAAPPLPGQWEARLTFYGPGDAAFDIRRRVMVP